jgi:hypothetical protein
MSHLPSDEPTRFDAILVVIAVAMTAGALLGHLSAVPMYVGIIVGSAVSMLALFEGLVRNPPEA